MNATKYVSILDRINKHVYNYVSFNLEGHLSSYFSNQFYLSLKIVSGGLEVVLEGMHKCISKISSGLLVGELFLNLILLLPWNDKSC